MSEQLQAAAEGETPVRCCKAHVAVEGGVEEFLVAREAEGAELPAVPVEIHRQRSHQAVCRSPEVIRRAEPGLNLTG